MLKRCLLTLATALACILPLTAQQVVWSTDFATTLQNREGGDDLRPDQTFLFTRLTPEVGIRLADADSVNIHTLKGGVNWVQPINDVMSGYKVVPSIYYNYTHREQSHRWDVALGWVPRTTLTERVARYLWSDSMSFEHPAVRGAVVKYAHQLHGGFDLLLDWRQMQTERKREAFNVLVNGRWYPSATTALWLGGTVQYNHLAKRKNAPEDEGVNDDITLNPMLGWHMDLPRWNQDGFAQEWNLAVKVGAIINRERARVENKWHSPCAFVAAASAGWRWLQLDEDLMAGKDLMPLWDRFGSQLNLGDTYYKSKFYSRTQLTAHIVHNAVVDLNCSLSFHATDKTTGFWQQISCRFYIDQDLWRHHGKGSKKLAPAY